MTFTKDDLINVLRLRYDYYSASSMLDTARERASVADKPSFEAADVRAIRAVLPSIGDRLTAVLEHLDEMLGVAPAAKDAPKKDEKKPEPAKAEEPKAEIKAEKSDKTEAPKVEVKAEKSDKTEEPKAEEPKADEAKADDDKADAAS